MKPPFAASHEATPQGVYWAVRDAEGFCVAFGVSKECARKIAALLTLICNDAATLERLTHACRIYISPRTSSENRTKARTVIADICEAEAKVKIPAKARAGWKRNQAQAVSKK